MAVDDSSLLPKPPPPRPARREAVIETALRRFDGAEEPSTGGRQSVKPPSGWTRHPQFGLAMSAALVAVIGIPATVIGIRNDDSGSRQEAAEPPPPITEFGRDSVPAQTAAESPPQPDRAAEALSPAPGKRLDRESSTTLPVADVSDSFAASPVAAVVPPPSPAPAPPIQQKSEPAEGQVMVTGSRIQAPSLSSDSLDLGRAEGVRERRAGEAPAAPDSVSKDRSYRTFLTRLQAAVRADDRDAVTGLIAYPLRVNSAGRAASYPDARSVRADFDRIFTPRVKHAILNQRVERVSLGDHGVMIGTGAVWFGHVCANSACSPPGPVRITAVNP